MRHLALPLTLLLIAHYLVHLEKVSNDIFVIVEPLMRQGFPCRGALVGIRFKHQHHKVFTVIRGMLDVLGYPRDVASDVSPQGLFHVLPRE
jgi:hypothetical protein